MMKRLIPLILVLALSGAEFSGSRAASKRLAEPAPQNRYVVIIVLDGARPNYLHLAPMPNLDKLIHTGVVYSNAFVGQELANTPPSHATIGTGDFPKHTGVMGFLWENPVDHTMFDPTETSLIENGTLDRLMLAHHVPSIAGRVKLADRRARIASVAGHKCYASDTMGTPSADYILCALIYHNRWVAAAIAPHIPPPGAINNYAWDVPIPPRNSGFGAAVQQWKEGGENAWSMKYAIWAFKKTHPRVLMLNLAETDVLGHFSKNLSVMRYLMKRFDGELGQLIAAYRQAGIFNRTDFIITADHGMTRIKHYMSFQVIRQAVEDAGASTVYVEHDTAASMGLIPRSSSRQVAVNILNLSHGQVEATYYKVYRNNTWLYALAAAQRSVSASLRHAYLVLADTMASDSGPDVYAVYAPRVSTRNFSAFGYTWDQGHLGPQWGDQHIPMIISGPGVKQGARSTYPARLIDIAPTVEHLLGLRSGGVDGRVLEDALAHPSPIGLLNQNAREKTLMPIVKALKAHWKATS